AVPGMVMFRAVAKGRTVGLELWYVQGNCVQGHLAAFDSLGYTLRASYPTKWRAIEYFNDPVQWVNLGGGTHRHGGLSRCKRGWSTGTTTAWLCGRVLGPARYAELSHAAGGGADYFPAYRRGEFS